MNKRVSKEKLLEAENKKLINELTEANLAIEQLRDQVNKLTNNFTLNLYTAIEQITNDYSIILNPPPVNLTTAYKGKHEEFSLKLSDIVCINCKGKVKTISLVKSVENTKGKYRETDSIIVDNNSGLEKFRHSLDSISYHLIQVSRNTVVNMKYYDLKGNFLKTTLDNIAKTDLARIEISGSQIDNFIIRKQQLDKLISLQKTLTRYID
jgi:hypothetical protein